MKLAKPVFLAVLLVIGLGMSELRANFIMQYTGNAFQPTDILNTSGDVSAGDFVSAQATFSSIPAFPSTGVAPSLFSITFNDVDGSNSFTLSSAVDLINGVPFLSFGPSGAVSGWQLALNSIIDVAGTILVTNSSADTVLDTSTGVAQNMNPGTWNVAAIPEPSSFLFLSLIAVGLAGIGTCRLCMRKSHVAPS